MPIVKSLLNSGFSDIQLEAQNQPCWEYLHHRHGQMLKIKTLFTPSLGESVVKTTSHYWLEGILVWISMMVELQANQARIKGAREGSQCRA
jgi:hypothetical protein